MYSLSLLGAAALVLLGGRVLIQVGRDWLAKNPTASRQHGFHVSEITSPEQQDGGVGSH